MAILLGTGDPDATAHALLAPLAAGHVAGVLPEIGADRLRAAVARLFCATTRNGDAAPGEPGSRIAME